MSKVYSGNAREDGLQSGGWFLGNLGWVAKDSIRRTTDLSLKYSKHLYGDANNSAPISGPQEKTITILLNGKFDVTVEGKLHKLREPGDYVIWGPGVNHSWECQEDCSTMLTVRWPSGAITQSNKIK